MFLNFYKMFCHHFVQSMNVKVIGQTFPVDMTRRAGKNARKLIKPDGRKSKMKYLNIFSPNLNYEFATFSCFLIIYQRYRLARPSFWTAVHETRSTLPPSTQARLVRTHRAVLFHHENIFLNNIWFFKCKFDQFNVFCFTARIWSSRCWRSHRRSASLLRKLWTIRSSR